MDSVSTIIIAIVSSGLVAAIVSAIMQKQNEKETRLFNAKLEAYKEFASHLETKFASLTNQGKNLDIITLSETSAHCLLVANKTLNQELKSFLREVERVYKRCSSPDYNKQKESGMFDKLWTDADKIESLMREDLGFK